MNLEDDNIGEEDGAEEDDGGNYETTQFDVDVLYKLMSNDPSIVALDIWFDDNAEFRINDVDWIRLGDAIANNTHLKKLDISGFSYGDEAVATNFFTAVARNRSIRHLCIESVPVFLGEEGMFTILSESLVNNNNLLSFDVSNCSMDTESSDILTSALLGNKSLRRFNFQGDIDDQLAAQVIGALSKIRSLRGLELIFDISEGHLWMKELGNLLQHPDTGLEELDLPYNEIDDKGASILGHALAKNKKLKSLKLPSIESISSIGWGALLSWLSGSSSLEVLDVSGNGLDDDSAAVIARALAGNTTLKGLYLGDNMSEDGWTTFFNTFKISNCIMLQKLQLSTNTISPGILMSILHGLANSARLKELELEGMPSMSSIEWQTIFNIIGGSSFCLEQLLLGNNSIDDEAAASLVDALGSMNSLKRLHINRNGSITNVGLRAVTELLQRPQCNIEMLYLFDNEHINDEFAVDFAKGLVNNSKLRHLNINGESNFITTTGWAAIANSLCNKEKVDSIFNSNHAFENLMTTKQPPRELESYLTLNKNKNKAEVTRSKIIQYHFSGGLCHLEEFVNMESNVLPAAVAWVARDGTGFTLLHQLVKTMPSLFDFVSNNAQFVGAKRKRGLQ